MFLQRCQHQRVLKAQPPSSPLTPLAPPLLPKAGDPWLLECNCPPSQDTATGLPHAEAVHDGVIGDLLDLVVVPALTAGSRGGVDGEAAARDGAEGAGGGPTASRADDAGEWECARPPNRGFEPAAKTTGNRMRWKMHERRETKLETAGGVSFDPSDVE